MWRTGVRRFFALCDDDGMTMGHLGAKSFSSALSDLRLAVASVLWETGGVFALFLFL